jgi:hypothetical protein
MKKSVQKSTCVFKTVFGIPDLYIGLWIRIQLWIRILFFSLEVASKMPTKNKFPHERAPGKDNVCAKKERKITIQKSTRVLKEVFGILIPDLYQWITDLDPALDPDLALFFTSDFQDAKNNKFPHDSRESPRKTIIYI